MSRIPKTYARAGCVACLAIAVAAATAFAQQQQDEAQYPSQQQSSDDESQSQQQDSQSTQSDQQREKQAQQRGQQQKQRAKQSQRGEPSRQRDRQHWNEQSAQSQQGRFPEASRDSQWSRDREWSGDRDQFGRDQKWSREYQYSRDSQRSGSDREAGLGVSIAPDDIGAILVVRVYADSPAEEMGIQEGDRITRVNGREIQSPGEFISRIRNMNPGQEVELDVQRDNEEQTFRGELESRQQALVMRGGPIRGQSRWQQGRDIGQTGYEEDRQSGPTPAGQSGRSVDRQVSQIERQLNQLSREIEELRFAVQELRDQSGRSSRETTARYDEYRDRDFQGTPGGRQSGQRGQRSGQFQSNERDQSGRQSGQYQSREFGQQSGQSQGTRSRDVAEDQSIGGEIGEERTRTGSEIHDRN